MKLLFNKNLLVFLISLCGAALVLNLIWENMHAHLYTHINPFVHLLPYYLLPTIADIIGVISLFLIMAVILKNTLWYKNLSAKRVLLLVSVGAIGATLFEVLATTAHWWSYNSSMPQVPWARVALTPILQMAILPLLSIVAADRISKIFRN